MNILEVQQPYLAKNHLSGRWQSLFPYRAAIAFALLLVLPLVYTLDLQTFLVNRNAGILLLSSGLLLAPALRRDLLRPPSSHKIGGVLILFGIFCVAWQWQHGDLWLNSQFLLYSGIAAMFPLSVRWFRQIGSDGLKYVFLLKLGGVLAATALFALSIAELKGEGAGIGLLVREPPIYRDSRHFNYDHLVVLSLAAYYASLSKTHVESILWFVGCVAISYVLAWSGGRAAIGALFVFLFITGWTRAIPKRTISAWVFAFLIAVALLVLTGRSSLFFSQFGQFTRVADGADVVTNGRIELWTGILGVWSNSWASIWFGFGPDAVRMVARAQIGFPPWVQSHSAIIQTLIEFGLIGLLLMSVATFIVAKRALCVLRSTFAPAPVRVSAALLFALGAYMLVDGILYHAIPLIMVMLLTAYVFHFDIAAVAKAVPGNSATAS